MPSRLNTAVSRVVLVLAGYVGVVGAVLVLPTTSRPGAARADRVAQGERVWLEGNCSTCHALYGLGGHLGPDLTNIVRDKGDAYVKIMTLSGRPGMPPFPATADQLEALTTYLDYVGETGAYPPRRRPLPMFGDLR
ncbi:MAG: cytochrome c [Thermoanaerobaculia bacterium]